MKVLVAVPCPNHMTIALEVSKDDTVASVKAKLHDMVRIPPSRQRLVFACSALPDDDDTTLGDHGVTDSSMIQLVKTGIQVYVRGIHRATGDRTISISAVESSDTVESFRLRVQEHDRIGWRRPAQQRDEIGIRPEQQRLTLGGKQLQDGHTLADYGVQDDTTMHLSYRPSSSRTRVVELDIEDTDTVGRIKERVEEAEEVPVACQRVYYCGKELDDGGALADCGALEWSTPVKIVIERQERGGTTNMTTKGEAPVVVKNETAVKRRTDVDVSNQGEKIKKSKRIKTKRLAETEAAETPAVNWRRFRVYLIGPELAAICSSSCDMDPAP